MPDPTIELAYAYGTPEADAVIRARPEDFVVEEVLGFEPSGEGEHAYLKIKKCGLNTRAVAQMLARHAGVRSMDVGFAGMKDRNAVTTQWFSVGLAGRNDPDWDALQSDALEVVKTMRHGKKLRPGQLKLNRFRINLSDIHGDRETIKARLDSIASGGVPNYFGPQRFGQNGANLDAAREVFLGKRKVRDRRLKGIYLSAARAQVFNQVLSARVASGSWNRALPGDVLMFDDSRSRFTTEGEDMAGDPRIETLELHPTGPLWGSGSPDTNGEVAAMEREAAESLTELTAGLEAAGLKADRRALRLRVSALEYEGSGAQGIAMTFALRPGAFATAVLREIVNARGPVPDQPG